MVHYHTVTTTLMNAIKIKANRKKTKIQKSMILYNFNDKILVPNAVISY